MNFMKRFWTILLALVLAFSLTACGGGTEENEEESGEKNGNVIELSYWYSMDGAGGEIFNKHIEEFNATIGAEKGIHVTGVYQDWPGTDALTAAMTTDDVDNMPDVIHMFSEYVNLIRDWERTAWAEDFITQSDAISKDDLIPNTVSAYSIDGKMIGVPYAVSSLLLYYNKDELAAAGYDAPPATIAEMAEMLPAITAATSADYGLNVRINQQEFENFIAIQGPEGTYFGNNDSGHSGMLSELTCQEEIEKFLTEWEKVINSGAYKATTDSMNEEFAQGLNAMCIMSSARIPTMEELIGDSFEWGVAPVPVVSEGDAGGAFPSGSGLFMIDRDDPERLEAAWEFVQYLLSADAQAMWFDGCGYVPVNRNAEETDIYKSAIEAQPRLSVPFDILKNSPATIVGSYCPAADNVNTVIQSAMLDFANGVTDKDETYTVILDGINAAFADYFRTH